MFNVEPTFLSLPPSEWSNDASFVKLGRLVSALRPVNDAAERLVKFGSDFTGVITKDEDVRQDILQEVELTRRAFPKATRKCVAQNGKKMSDDVLDLMASTTNYDARLDQ
jgi:hypothetical protein